MDTPIRVLYVDKTTSAEMTSRFLEQEDGKITVEMVTSTDAGLDHIADTEVDCIVSEYEIPSQNGIEFLATIREDHPDLPFILYTREGSEEIAAEAIEAGVDSYLQKGHDTDKHAVLADRIRSHVKKYRERSCTDPFDHEYSLIADTATDVFWTIDAVSGEMTFSDGLHQFGYDPEDIEPTLDWWYERLHPDDVDRIRNKDEAVFACEEWAFDELSDDRGQFTNEYRWQRADGTYAHCRERGAIVIEGDEPVKIVGTKTDITERKQREQELRKTKRKYQALAENIPDGVVCLFDDDLQLTMVAGKGSSEIERNPVNAEGKTLQEVVSEEQHAKLAPLYQGALHGEYNSADSRFAGRILHHQLIPINDRCSEADYGMALIRDVTEQRQRERERKMMVEFLEALYDITTDSDLAFDAKINAMLELGCETLDLPYGFITRIEVDDAAGPFGTQTISKSHGDHELLQAGESCPLSRSYCRKTIEKDGQLVIQDAIEAGWEDDPAYDLFDLGSYIGDKITTEDEVYGTLCFASTDPREEAFTDLEQSIVQFINKCVSYELERQQNIRELHRQNERLEEFASIASHDLRSPLNAASGHLEAAQSEFDSEHLTHIAEAHDRMNTLIEEFLTFAQAGERAISWDAVDLVSLADRCWAEVATTEATLVVDTDQTVLADIGLLRQLLENLFKNAITHGGPDVTVTIGDIDDGFYVADDGPGIPEAKRQNVFELGYSTAADGVGFGLSIVNELVEAHEWEIDVTESADGGARFEIIGVERSANSERVLGQT